MTNFYKAFNNAADLIEEDPGKFMFTEGMVPQNDDACGSPSCALGWIGFFAGMRNTRQRVEWSGSVAEAIGVEETTFYHQMTGLVGLNWYDSAAVCAKGLRLYADEHFGYQKRPVWAQMRDREAQARIDAEPAYARFHQGLVLESVPQAPPGNSVPSNVPDDEDEIL